MKYAIVTLTSGAFNTGKKLRDALEESTLYTLPARNDGTAINIDTKFSKFTSTIFKQYEIIIFIMATGIVARTIAPLIKNKINDPGIVVMDERGEFAISLLSGHMGGANDAVKIIANKTGARPVITTSTDVNQLVSVDVFAKQNNLIIDNLDDCKNVTSILVNGGTVALLSDIEVPPPSCYSDDIKSADAIILITNKINTGSTTNYVKLIPPNIIIGMGSRKDSNPRKARNFLYRELIKLNIDHRAVKYVATIDSKKKEKAIIETAKHLGAELKIFTADEISEVENLFLSSKFVKSTVGVSAVSGPSAYLASNRKGKMIAEKLKQEGVTISIWQEEK